MSSFAPGQTTWNRADFVTLRDGGITLYHAKVILAEDVEWLSRAGYSVIEFDGEEWLSERHFFDAFAPALGFPSYFGYNLDAFNECLSEDSQIPEGGLVIVIRSIDSAVRNLGETFVQTALDLFSLASHEQLLYGRRFMFLLQSGDPRIGFRPVGARPVCWNSREFLNSSRGVT